MVDTEPRGVRERLWRLKVFEPVQTIILAVEALRRAHASDPLVRHAGSAVDDYLDLLERER